MEYDEKLQEVTHGGKIPEHGEENIQEGEASIGENCKKFSLQLFSFSENRNLHYQEVVSTMAILPSENSSRRKSIIPIFLYSSFSPWISKTLAATSNVFVSLNSNLPGSTVSAPNRRTEVTMNFPFPWEAVKKLSKSPPCAYYFSSLLWVTKRVELDCYLGDHDRHKNLFENMFQICAEKPSSESKSLGSPTASMFVKIIGRGPHHQFGEIVHFCLHCDLSIPLYGCLGPCNHVFCLDCARSDSLGFICEECIQKIQTLKMMEGILTPIIRSPVGFISLASLSVNTSTFTTEPFTAFFIFPHEPMQLTTLSSLEVPLAQLLASSFAHNRRHSTAFGFLSEGCVPFLRTSIKGLLRADGKNCLLIVQLVSANLSFKDDSLSKIHFDARAKFLQVGVNYASVYIVTLLDVIVPMVILFGVSFIVVTVTYEFGSIIKSSSIEQLFFMRNFGLDSYEEGITLRTFKCIFEWVQTKFGYRRELDVAHGVWISLVVFECVVFLGSTHCSYVSKEQNLSRSAKLDKMFLCRVQPLEEETSLSLQATNTSSYKERFNNALDGFSKASVSMIWQFGVSLYLDHFMAEKGVDTAKHNNNVKYNWNFKTGGTFIVIRSTLGKAFGKGTKITFFFKGYQCENLEERQLYDSVKMHSEFNSYPISLWVEETIEQDQVNTSQLYMTWHDNQDYYDGKYTILGELAMPLVEVTNKILLKLYNVASWNNDLLMVDFIQSRFLMEQVELIKKTLYIATPILLSIKDQLKEDDMSDFVAERIEVEALDMINIIFEALEGSLLRYLNPSNNALDEKGVRVRRELLQSHTSLQEGIVLFEALGTSTHLKKLNLWDNMVDVEIGLVLCRSILFSENFTEIYLSYLNLEVEDWVHLIMLHKQSTVSLP